jgi:hypothetical protein
MHSNFRKRYLRWYWQQNKDRYHPRDLIKLGTTDFKSNMCRYKDGTPDYKREQQEINKEKQRIQQQRRIPNWHSSWINDNRVIEDKVWLQHKHAIAPFIPKIEVN